MALTTSGAEEGQGYALTYEIKRISKIAVASMDVVRCQRRYMTVRPDLEITGISCILGCLIRESFEPFILFEMTLSFGAFLVTDLC